MNKLYKAIWPLVVFSSTLVNAQSPVKLFAELNYNTYSHSDLKDFQKELVGGFNEVELRSGENFDSGLGFTLGADIRDLNTSFFFSYMVTGAKNSYSDISGAVSITQEVDGYFLGGEKRFNFIDSGDLSGLSFGLRGFIFYNTLEVTLDFRVFDSSNSDNLNFNGYGIGVGGRIIYELPIAFFRLGASIGYDLAYTDKLSFNSDSNFHLEDESGDKVKPQWSGLRIGISFRIPVNI